MGNLVVLNVPLVQTRGSQRRGDSTARTRSGDGHRYGGNGTLDDRDDTTKGRDTTMTHLMRRITSVSAVLALGLALVLGAATPAMAADDARGRCIGEAARAGLIGSEANPGNTNFVGGTEGNDNFTGRATAGPDVFCGFGGDDRISTLDAGDAFLGGAGDDEVVFLDGGTFDGGAGNDFVSIQFGGTFNGGEGDDRVADQLGGTFDGGAGNDTVDIQSGGTFNGGEGNDFVSIQFGGTFNGGEGNDFVSIQFGGTFNGGAGDDRVADQLGGTFNQD